MPKNQTNTIRAADLCKEFEKVKDRAELIALLAPLRLPKDVSESEKLQIGNALIRATWRC
jgi:hypothetical protein